MWGIEGMSNCARLLGVYVSFLIQSCTDPVWSV